MSLLFAAAALAAIVGGGAGDQESPLVCNLEALTPAERTAHAATTKRLVGSIVRIDDVEGGYRIHVSQEVAARDLLQWVEAERRCCPFLDFEVRLAREDGPRWLQLTGREGVKAFLAAEFKLADRR